MFVLSACHSGPNASDEDGVSQETSDYMACVAFWMDYLEQRGKTPNVRFVTGTCTYEQEHEPERFAADVRDGRRLSDG
jgi:hypothetical protein